MVAARLAVGDGLRGGALGASVALHGALAAAAILPFLAAEPFRPAAPGGVEMVWISAPAAPADTAPAAEATPAAEPEPIDALATESVAAEIAAPPPPPIPDMPPQAAPIPSPPAAPVQRSPRPAPAQRAERAAPPRPATSAARGAETNVVPAAAAAPAVAPATPPGPILVTAPRYRSPPAPPVYPPRAIELGLTGTVILRARIGADGGTEEIRVWRTSGHPLLDAAALAAVRRWAFEPASLDGRRVEAWVEVPVHFRLN